ncbi:hypothetical protein ARMA_2844 [Ardenticatena maritima]|uniref:Alpha/beta hydrolase fold-5 domain-containing protein n=1 Tax=Ardenticatena maritima TaxID=872965 RepID=A0A0M8KAT2_9CHLR|nr:alpha/beta hydrolase [Ardenticatena maritima]KPL89464.1 hypothetical protein SE16_03220 [Ardenticatena maritima]GAP64421.1 hypothetical protein ARMA_2844 [Ardenticatena maritima]
MRTWGKRLLLLLIAGLLIAVAGFFYWALNPLPAMPEAEAALQSDTNVHVETTPWFTFIPQTSQPRLGFILYPGGHVDPRAYAPPARRLAEEGWLVVIPPMPLNLAFFAPNKAEEIIAAHPEIEVWVIGGHSLGGAMAVRFARTHPQQVAGLVLWASYPAESDAIADWTDFPVLSIYGTEDGGREGIEASAQLLPPETEWVVIEGGNHAQFGWYGPQPGDGVARISREEQQAIILEATARFLHAVAAQHGVETAP